MTRDELKRKVGNLWTAVVEMSILRAEKMRKTGCSWGAAFDDNPEAKAAQDRAGNILKEIESQIDLMYQGASDDESFPDDAEYQALTDFNSCSYCGEPMHEENLMLHKDGSCVK